MPRMVRAVHAGCITQVSAGPRGALLVQLDITALLQALASTPVGGEAHSSSSSSMGGSSGSSKPMLPPMPRISQAPRNSSSSGHYSNRPTPVPSSPAPPAYLQPGQQQQQHLAAAGHMLHAASCPAFNLNGSRSSTPSLHEGAPGRPQPALQQQHQQQEQRVVALPQPLVEALTAVALLHLWGLDPALDSDLVHLLTQTDLLGPGVNPHLLTTLLQQQQAGVVSEAGPGAAEEGAGGLGAGAGVCVVWAGAAAVGPPGDLSCTFPQQVLPCGRCSSSSRQAFTVRWARLHG
jgi:hypothetical protein